MNGRHLRDLAKARIALTSSDAEGTPGARGSLPPIPRPDAEPLARRTPIVAPNEGEEDKSISRVSKAGFRGFAFRSRLPPWQTSQGDGINERTELVFGAISIVLAGQVRLAFCEAGREGAVVRTVAQAFSQFCGDVVDLDPGETATARASRDYLHGQLRALAARDSTFPEITDHFIPYGSFARRTKIRPLDDIDTTMILHAGGGVEYVSPFAPHTYRVWMRDRSVPLSRFADSDGYVSSIRVLNSIKAALGAVSNYRSAESKRNMQAVVLDLASYSWSFDIVPSAGVSDGLTGVAHYLIPDGKGDWIRTDPRRDRDRVNRVNGYHSGLLLPTMRLIKYWNTKTFPRLSSYHIETLALDVFEGAAPVPSIRVALEYFFRQCQTSIFASCPDPKNLGPALDATLAYDIRLRVAQALADAAKYTRHALMYEASADHDRAIYWWARVFGPEFPTYG